jgi:membrane protein DedA with SNARE-associated domain
MNPSTLIENAGGWAYTVVFALTAGETSAFIGLVLPGETLILLASALAAKGALDPLLLTVAVVGGGVTGDSVGYALGRWSGRWHTPRRLRRFQDRHTVRAERMRTRVERAREFLVGHGGSAVFIGRFIGFVRSFLPFVAGAVRLPYPRFLGFSAAASLVWGVGNVAVGYFLGSAAGRLLHTAGVAGAGVAGAVAFILLLVFRLRRRIFHARGSH